MRKVLNSLLARLLVRVAAEDGQGLTEYALIVTLIALVAVVALTTIGGHVTDALSTAGLGVAG